MSSVRLLELGEVDWLRTQSVYHAIAETFTEATPDTIILTRPRQPYLCLGYHQNYYAILDHQACDRLGLQVVRRRVGGGTTYLDSNQQFYQCIFHHKRVPPKVTDVYAQLLAAPIKVLSDLGLDAALRDVNEVEVSGKRIAGIGGGRVGESVIVVGNVLLDFDYKAMLDVWHTPTEAFQQFAEEALHDRLVTLWGMMQEKNITPDDIQSMLIDAYATTLDRPVVPGELTDEEWEKVAEYEQKLVSDAWLKLHSEDQEPMSALKIARGLFIHHKIAEIGPHRVEATLHVEDDLIVQAALSGAPDGWESLLVGVRLKEWSDVLASVVG